MNDAARPQSGAASGWSPQDRLVGVFTAAAALVALSVVKMELSSLIGRPTPYLLYFVAIVLGAWRGGLTVGLGTAVVAALLGHYLFTEPVFAFGLFEPAAGVQFASFLVEGVVLSVVTAFAVRDRRRALATRDESRAAAAALRSVLDGIDDGIVVQDDRGRVRYANEGAARILGFPTAASLTHAPGAAVLDRFEVLDEGRRPVTADQMPGRNAVTQGVAVERELLFRVRATGEERWSFVRSRPLTAAGGRREVISLLHDITQRRRDEARRSFVARAAQELSSSLDYADTLRRLTRLAVPEVADWAAVDLVEDGRVARLAVAHVDPAKIALVEEIERRYPTDPDAPTGLHHVIRTGRAEMVADIPPEILAAAARDPEHLRLIEALGLRSYLAVPLTVRGVTLGALTFATAESGRGYGAEDLALATALADRAAVAIEHARLYQDAGRARADAELANRSKDEFLAMLGHELRNPLAPILTALTIMKMRGGHGHERELGVIERQVKHVVRLVDDLLDVSRITRGKVELKMERLDVAEVVARAAEMALPLIEQRAHRLEVDVPAGLTVRGDAVRLAQVVANLLNNAAKYTEKGGRIDVVGRRVEASVEVSVRDHGIGIPPAMLPRVFDMFAQAPQALDRALGGLGLGLAIVKSLVALHGGAVAVHSDGAGAGSVFSVRLPALDGEVTARVALPGPALGARASRPQPVLVVDDNDDAADMLADVLAAMGHDVRKAHDGPSALAAAAEHRPSLALLDIGLPVMDGYELARRLRAMEALGGIKLVAVSGYGQEADRQRSAAAGFDVHLVKPIDLDALPALVARLTGGPPRPEG